MSEHRNGSRHAVIIIDKRGSFAGDTVARNRSRHVLAHARVVFVYSHLFEPFFLGDAFNAIKTHRFVRTPPAYHRCSSTHLFWFAKITCVYVQELSSFFCGTTLATLSS